jgi:hypothetical protein
MPHFISTIYIIDDVANCVHKEFILNVVSKFSCENLQNIQNIFKKNTSCVVFSRFSCYDKEQFRLICNLMRIY